jgi:hypothetical protein
MGKTAPWLVSVLLAIVAGYFWFAGTQKDATITKQADELQLAKANFDSLRADYSKLVDEANKKIAYANLPDVPVKLSTSKGIVASGYVLQVQNTSDKTIAISLSVERPSDGKTKVYELTLDGGVFKRIGELEGWAFITGDKVKVAQSEHKPLEVSIK